MSHVRYPSGPGEAEPRPVRIATEKHIVEVSAGIDWGRTEQLHWADARQKVRDGLDESKGRHGLAQPEILYPGKTEGSPFTTHALADRRGEVTVRSVRVPCQEIAG